MQGNLILNADPTANLGAATKQYVDKANFKQIYKGSLTDGQTISVVTNYKIMVGFTTITHNTDSNRYPMVVIDNLEIGYSRGNGVVSTDYFNFILFNFDNKSGSFFRSIDLGTTCGANAQNTSLKGKIAFSRVQSASLSLYALS